MAKEIERKYRARFANESTDHWNAQMLSDEVIRSLQSYLVARKGWEWRIRSLETVKHRCRAAGEITWYTAIKVGNGFVRDEYEIKLPAWLGKLLLRMAPAPIFKTRFHANGWEVDYFHSPQALTGLLLAEAEVETEHSPFPEPPTWIQLVEDVTNHGGYANKNLCLRGLPE